MVVLGGAAVIVTHTCAGCGAARPWCVTGEGWTTSAALAAARTASLASGWLEYRTPSVWYCPTCAERCADTRVHRRSLVDRAELLARWREVE